MWLESVLLSVPKLELELARFASVSDSGYLCATQNPMPRLGGEWRLNVGGGFVSGRTPPPSLSGVLRKSLNHS